MQLVEAYDYLDAAGSLVYQVERWIGDDSKKTFKQLRVLPDGSTAYGLTKETPRLLYRLPSVLKSKEVFIVEGEKDVHTLEKIGVVATTPSGGSGAPWDEAWTEALADKDLVVIPDNDDPGKKRLEDILIHLQDRAKSIAVVWLPAPSKDITDFLIRDKHSTEELNALIQSARLAENHPLRRVGTLIQKKGTPLARESEKLVLGGVLNGTVSFSDIDPLQIGDFGVDAHRKIFSAMQSLDKAIGVCDLKAVIDRLTEKDQIDEVGGISYLIDLTEDLPSVYNVETHVETIQRKASSRRLLDDLMKQAEGLVVGADPDEVRSAVLDAIDSTSAYGRQDLPTTSAADIIANFPGFFEKRKPGIMCEPIDDIMQQCYGLQEGQLFVVGGRPSSGKSSLASLIAAFAAKQGHETEIISLEIGKEECLLKMICMVAKVSLLDVYSGRLDDAQKNRLLAAANAFHRMPLRIDDNSGWTVSKLRTHLKKRRASGNRVRLLVIDYLQLMGSGRQDGRRDLELGAITRGLKLLAKEFGLTVILLSQMNRDMDKNNRMPQMSDLRDSGSIEADADMIWLTWQNVAEDRPDSAERDALIIVAKQRNGAIGPYPVKFAKPFAFFYSPACKSIDYRVLLPANSNLLLPACA